MSVCDVRGCEREGTMGLARSLPTEGGAQPRVVILHYCPAHYGEANRFQGGRRRDRRPVQADA